MRLPRIYALGNSPLLSVLSHQIASLALQPKVPEVVLLLQDQKKLSRFLKNNSKLAVNEEFDTADKSKQLMASCSPPAFASGEIAKVENLIVGEPRRNTLHNSIGKYSQSISPETNVLLLNAELGSVEYLNESIWPNEAQRPNLLIGDTDPNFHVWLNDEFSAKHRGYRSKLRIIPVPREFSSHSEIGDVSGSELSTKENSFINLLCQLNRDDGTRALNLTMGDYNNYVIHKFRILSRKFCIGSLSVLNGCRQDEVKLSPRATTLMRELSAEHNKILNVAYPHISNENLFDVEQVLNAPSHITTKSFLAGDDTVSSKTLSDLSRISAQFHYLASRNKVACPKSRIISTLVRGKLDIMQKRRMI
ncbi:LAMI_0H18866g1_1 [Lachancea mirantina]|uniref:LAMI_0H18866g1_1 n=1 Tax=Lachancea mirantina TaxID=1230905 RepID=A0A1G4KJN7_9SACH|nr:LAMI_0H18866g1_1 [Lachancea mirantina]